MLADGIILWYVRSYYRKIDQVTKGASRDNQKQEIILEIGTKLDLTPLTPRQGFLDSLELSVSCLHDGRVGDNRIRLCESDCYY